MRSGTSFFNGTLYRKAFFRFWPIWALYGTLWLLVIPFPLLTTALQGGSTGLTNTAGRLAEMVRELDLGPKEVGLIVNRAPGGRLSDGVREEIDRHGLKLMGVVPHDDTVYEYDAEGRPSVTVPENSPVKQAVRAIFDQLAL